MVRIACYLLIAFLCIMQTPVRAEEEKASSGLTKEQIDEIGKHVHALLAKAKTSDGKLIGEETAKTLKYPLVPYDLMEFVIVRGHIAGFAAHCELDWQNKYYRPLMDGLRAKLTDYTDYQWAFVGMLHGASMGGAEQSMIDKKCEPQMKENLEKAVLQ